MLIVMDANMAAKKKYLEHMSCNLVVETTSYHSKINLRLRNIRFNTSSSARTVQFNKNVKR